MFLCYTVTEQLSEPQQLLHFAQLVLNLTEAAIIQILTNFSKKNPKETILPDSC